MTKEQAYQQVKAALLAFVVDDLKPIFHEYEDGRVALRACDDEFHQIWFDYWGEFEYPQFIHKNLEEIAEANGFYWEWQDTGEIVLCENFSVEELP